MPEEFHRLEESLKEFLMDEQSDNYNSRNANLYKYNNLKVFMSPSQNKNPHFIIRIGISEAMYDISTGDKISGGLGSDERHIRKWLDRSFIKTDLGSAWEKSKRVKPVIMKKDLDD